MVELWEVWKCEGELCMSLLHECNDITSMSGVWVHMAGRMALQDLEI